MASLLDSLFGRPDASPTLDTVQFDKAAQQGADYNKAQFDAFKDYSPSMTKFMQNLFNQSYGSQGLAADNTQFSIGSQLANQGQTDLMGNFFDYARRQGLETAASTGAPISGSFTQSLGANLGSQQLLKNQRTGVGLLNQYGQTQASRFGAFLQPSLNLMQNNMVNPQAFMQGAQFNNGITNQNKMIDFANSQRTSWFHTMLSDTAKSVVGAPFKFVGNSFDLAANSPQIVGGMAMNMCGGGGGAPSQGMPSQGFTPTSFSQSSGGGTFGLNSNMNLGY